MVGVVIPSQNSASMLLFCGGKDYFGIRNTLEFVIVRHPSHSSIEIIAYNPFSGVEAPRIYLSDLHLRNKIEKAEGFALKLEEKKVKLCQYLKQKTDMAIFTSAVWTNIFVETILGHLENDTDVPENGCRVYIYPPLNESPPDIVCHRPSNFQPYPMSQAQLKTRNMKYSPENNEDWFILIQLHQNLLRKCIEHFAFYQSPYMKKKLERYELWQQRWLMAVRRVIMRNNVTHTKKFLHRRRICRRKSSFTDDHLGYTSIAMNRVLQQAGGVAITRLNGSFIINNSLDVHGHGHGNAKHRDGMRSSFLNVIVEAEDNVNRRGVDDILVLENTGFRADLNGNNSNSSTAGAKLTITTSEMTDSAVTTTENTPKSTPKKTVLHAGRQQRSKQAVVKGISNSGVSSDSNNSNSSSSRPSTATKGGSGAIQSPITTPQTERQKSVIRRVVAKKPTTGSKRPSTGSSASGGSKRAGSTTATNNNGVNSGTAPRDNRHNNNNKAADYSQLLYEQCTPFELNLSDIVIPGYEREGPVDSTATKNNNTVSTTAPTAAGTGMHTEYTINNSTNNTNIRGTHNKHIHGMKLVPKVGAYRYADNSVLTTSHVTCMEILRENEKRLSMMIAQGSSSLGSDGLTNEARAALAAVNSVTATADTDTDNGLMRLNVYGTVMVQTITKKPFSLLDNALSPQAMVTKTQQQCMSPAVATSAIFDENPVAASPHATTAAAATAAAVKVLSTANDNHNDISATATKDDSTVSSPHQYNNNNCNNNHHSGQHSSSTNNLNSISNTGSHNNDTSGSSGNSMKHSASVGSSHFGRVNALRLSTPPPTTTITGNNESIISSASPRLQQQMLQQQQLEEC